MNAPRGFTLMELVFCIVIVGVLAAVGISKSTSPETQASKASIAQLAAAIEAGSGINQASLAAGSPSAFAVSGASVCSASSLARFAQSPIPSGVSIAAVGSDDCSSSSSLDQVSCSLSGSGMQATAKVRCARGTVAVDPQGWTDCAAEDSVCVFSGTRQVRYGLAPYYATRVATGSIACNNDVFGDPYYQHVKRCSYYNTPQ